MSNGTAATLAPETKQITRLNDLGRARDMVMIPIGKITIEPGLNPRDFTLPENQEHVRNLANQIKAQGGTKTPLWVRFDATTKTAIVVDGESRLRANQLLIAEGEDIVALPCITVKGNTVAERVLLALSANTTKTLNAWEIGNAYTRLVGYGYSEDQIAEKTGKTIAYIKTAIELASAPEEVKHLLSEQAITPARAISELRQAAPEVATETLRTVGAAAKAAGTTAKRGRAENKTINIMRLIEGLMETADQRDLDNPERTTIKVDKGIARCIIKALAAKKKAKAKAKAAKA